MDTSETYIKMCDCEEIQGIWQQKFKGDYPSEEDLYAKGDKVLSAGCSYHDPDLDPEPSDVWLPRQDQLQKMLLPDWKNERDAWGDLVEPDYKTDYVFWLAKKFADNIQERKRSQQSMEQLWLAFVMKEKYNKTWDGSDWI